MIGSPEQPAFPASIANPEQPAFVWAAIAAAPPLVPLYAYAYNAAVAAAPQFVVNLYPGVAAAAAPFTWCVNG